MKKKLATIIEALSKHLNECDVESPFEYDLHEAYNTAVELMEDADKYELKQKQPATIES